MPTISAHDWTNGKLEEMERHLRGIYSRAEKELGEAWKAYMQKADAELERLGNAYSAAKDTGDKTLIREAGRKLAAEKQKQTIYNTRYKALTKDLAESVSKVNQTAAAYINGQLPQIYAVNYNEVASVANKAVTARFSGRVSFELVDAGTIKRLSTVEENLLPYKVVNGKLDVRWNVAKINAEVTQGILQGESIPNISKRLSNVLDMNKTSAIRNARTTVTSAENKGRVDMMHDAAKKGVIMKKGWSAASDDRTRSSHAALDGEFVEMDDPFSNGLMYPGDPGGEPEEVYNCRCSLVYDVVGFRQNDENQESYFDEPNAEENRIFGTVDGMNYQISDSDDVDIKYSKREKIDGEWKTIRGTSGQFEIPENDSKTDVLVQTIGKPNVFMAIDETPNTILTDGRIAVNYNTGNNDTIIKVKAMIENEIDKLAGIRQDGVFYRVTENAKDANYIKTGKIRASINHMTGQKEDGVSCWERPKYFGTYMERITGDLVGIGSDGEPLLDPKTIKLIGVNDIDIAEARKKGREEFCNIFNWTQEQLENALKGKYKFLR